MKNLNISFIGAGNMTNALVGGLVASGIPPQHIHASNRSAKKLDELNNALGVFTYALNTDAVKQADILILAVKPQMAKSVCLQIKDEIQTRRPLVMSIMAGINIATLQNWLGESIKIVRCMPNTPSLIQLGASALFTASALSDVEKHQCTTIMKSVGIVYWVEEEELLDAVTAISGSGPAYFFRIIEIMQKIAQELGLSELLSQELVLQTIVGAAQMAKTSDYTVSTLRERVTSPGGTTEAALNAFEEGEIEDLFRHALTAAKQRSKNISAELSDES